MINTVHIYEPKYDQIIFGHTWLAQCGDVFAYGDSEHTAFWALVHKLKRATQSVRASPA